LVNALKTASENCPSKKLAELYNGITTTITSGGDLSEFFDKRATACCLIIDWNKKKKPNLQKLLWIFISAWLLLLQ
jgi:archaellum biogenesis protein FlaJ (TadC family)